MVYSVRSHTPSQSSADWRCKDCQPPSPTSPKKHTTSSSPILSGDSSPSLPSAVRSLSPDTLRYILPENQRNNSLYNSRSNSPNKTYNSSRSNSPSKSLSSWRSSSPTATPSSWRKESPNTSQESLIERSVASAYSEGDIIQLPEQVADSSVFKQNSAIYGEAAKHPLVVLEVHGDLLVCAQVTSFTTTPFREKCNSSKWAARYVPIGHKEHPFTLFGSWTLDLEYGTMRKSYANVETPLLVEAWACVPFTGTDGMPAKLCTKSHQWLLSQCAAFDLPRSVKYDYWASRQLLREILPHSKVAMGAGGSEPPFSHETGGGYVPKYFEKCTPKGAMAWQKSCRKQW